MIATGATDVEESLKHTADVATLNEASKGESMLKMAVTSAFNYLPWEKEHSGKKCYVHKGWLGFSRRISFLYMSVYGLCAAALLPYLFGLAQIPSCKHACAIKILDCGEQSTTVCNTAKEVLDRIYIINTLTSQ